MKGEPLGHTQIQQVMSALSEAKVVDLDASVRSLVEPIASALKLEDGSTVGLHVLCCNEYFLVTGLTGGPLGDIEQRANRISRSLDSS